MIFNVLLNKVFISIAGILFQKSIKHTRNGRNQITSGEFQNLVKTDVFNIGKFFALLYVPIYNFFSLSEITIFLFVFLGKFVLIILGAISIYTFLYFVLINQESKATEKKKLESQDNRMKYTIDAFTNI